MSGPPGRKRCGSELRWTFGSASRAITGLLMLRSKCRPSNENACADHHTISGEVLQSLLGHTLR